MTTDLSGDPNSLNFVLFSPNRLPNSTWPRICRIATRNVLVVAAYRREHIASLQVMGLVEQLVPQPDIKVIGLVVRDNGLVQFPCPRPADTQQGAPTGRLVVCLSVSTPGIPNQVARAA